MFSRLISFCSAVLVSCFFILSSGTFQIDVAADPYTLTFTSAQTLALYGMDIPALYFDGSTTKYVNFEYWKSSKQIVSAIEDHFEEPPFISAYYRGNPLGLAANSRTSGSLSRPLISNQIKSTNANDLNDWFGSRYPGKDKLMSYEFLIYRYQGEVNHVTANQNSFQFNFDMSVSISGVERFQSIFGISSGTMTNLNDKDSGSASSTYASEIRIYDSSSQNPLMTSSNWLIGTDVLSSGDRFNVCHFPVTCALPDNYMVSSSVNADADALGAEIRKACYPCPNMMIQAIDTGTLSTQTEISKVWLNIRGGDDVTVHLDGSYSPQEGTYSNSLPYVYLFVMCPSVVGEVVPPELPTTTPNYSNQLEDIQTGVGDININLDETNNRLDLILEKLDDIYNNMGVSVEGNDVDLTEDGPLSWVGTHIDNLGTSIVNGVRGLFIPSQTDLLNFRLNLQSDFQTHFPAFFTADDKVHNLYSIFNNAVTPRSSITVPTVSMSVSDVANNENASFSFGGYEVLLKPDQNRLGVLYDSLAFIIDAIATLGIINMLRSKIRKIFSGGNTD